MRVLILTEGYSHTGYGHISRCTAIAQVVRERNANVTFIVNGDEIEIRLPWSLLNFYNPSEMVIHDDYYENYGIEGIEISEMYAGVGTDANVQFPIKMGTVELKGWGTNPTWHERLKQGYYDLQELWKDKD